MIASKAPKARHLSASGSLSARVACVVGQKNEGRGYLGKVFESTGLSLGAFHSRHAARIDRKRKYNNDYQNSNLTFKSHVRMSTK